MLRPLTDLQIAMLFIKYNKYHNIFRSCNVGSKEDKWCSNCSKCLFVYIILSTFLSEDELIKIFGENLFDKKELKGIFMQLIGKTESKPFDCVGTYAEINYSICTTIARIVNSGEKLPYLLDIYYKEELSSKIEKAEGISEIYKEPLLEGFEANNLNEKFEKMLKKALKRSSDGRIN